MSRAWQAERAAEREQDALDREYANGQLTREEYNRACRELQRDLRAAHEEDLDDARRAVEHEWGWS